MKYDESRLAKLGELKQRGVEPYARRYADARPVADCLAEFREDADPPQRVRVAGRITAWRDFGKTTFADLRDRTGKLQIYCRRDKLGDDLFAVWSLLDVGDWVGVEGEFFRTRMGEITVKVDAFELLSKSLLGLPEKWHGLRDVELRCRKRYLDLISNPEVADVFRKRAAVTKTLRAFLDGRGYTEVVTPTLQPLYGGASARPFTTHHNALGIQLYMRIATELYLKRLIVGGMERVYEVGRNFRNEGIDRLHNPEFTVVEFYQAYADYGDMMALTQELLQEMARSVNGTATAKFNDREISLEGDWPRVPFVDAVREHAGVDLRKADVDTLRSEAARLGIEADAAMGAGRIMDLIFSHTVEHKLVEPTFIVDYPVETTPLARRRRDDPSLVERFEVFWFGHEIGNAFTELTDAQDQDARFREQVRLIEAGDDEAQPIDEDFVEALAHGMPPTGGVGIGVDRVVMMLTNCPTIRDVILFPLMRPERPGVERGDSEHHEGHEGHEGTAEGGEGKSEAGS